MSKPDGRGQQSRSEATHTRRLSVAYRSSTAICLCMACALSLTPNVSRAGQTLPNGGQYVAGQGSIAGSGNSLTVNQSTSHGIINWQNFSIGQGNSVFFNNGSGATLNRVTGGNLSQIDGSLKATGSVYLINPQGIVIGPGGQVITNGSFIASTRDVSNDAFMSGSAFSASGTSNGSIVNQGVITSNNGDAILVGSSVTNTGTISAPNGTVGLAAGNELLLQPTGSDSRIAISGGNGSVTNSGNLSAAQVELNSAGGNVYALVENNRGLVTATGTKTVGGHIWLTANGTATVTGTLSAANGNGSGGAVTVRGTDIEMSGVINASATTQGQTGGTVSIVATNSNTVSGTINTSGLNAHGGSVETSGHLLSIDGAKVNAGTGGNWLLDPYDLTVDAAAASTIDTSLNAGTSVTLQTTATGTSGPGNPNPSGNGDIFIDSAINWNTSATLTLDAYRNINIYAPITGTTLDLISGGAISQGSTDAITASTLTGSSVGSVYLPAANVIANVGNFSTSNAGFILTTAANLNIDGTLAVGSSYALLTVGGTLSESGAGAVTGAALTGTSQGAVTLNGANALTDLSGFTTANGAFTLANTQSFAVTGALNAGTGNVTLTTTGGGSNLALYSPVSGATVDLVSSGTLAQNAAGTITATTLTGSSNGYAYLSQANGIANLGSFSTGNSGFILTTTGNLNVNGALNVGTSYVLLAVGGTLGESGSGAIAGAALAGSSQGATTLNGANALTYLGGFTTANGAFALTDTQALQINGVLNAGTGNVTVTTGSGNDLLIVAPVTGGTVDLSAGNTLVVVASVTGTTADLSATGDLALNAPVSGGTVDLVSGGYVSQNTAGSIIATTLTGSSVGYTDLPDANAVSYLGAFSIANNALILTTAGNLTIDGAINVGSSYVLLNTGGTLAESGSGAITGQALSGTAQGAVTLNGANTLTYLGGFTTANGSFALTDTQSLEVTGDLDAGTGNVTLTTTGSGSNILLHAPVTGTTVTLTSAGYITQNTPGIIEASTLTGSSQSYTELPSANVVANLGNFATTNAGFVLTTAGNLNVDGVVAVGSSYALLNAGGTLSESGAGAITGTAFGGTSQGAATLNGANVFTDLAGFTTANGDFALTDGETLQVTGALNAGTGNVTLTTMGIASNLALYAALTGNTVDLVSSDGISQNAAGTITASTLTGSSGGGADTYLTAANTIADLGNFTTDNASFYLTTTGNLILNGVLSTGSALLNAGGTLTESGPGYIVSQSFGGTSQGAVTLNNTNNGFGDLTGFTTANGDFALTIGTYLTVTGALNAGTGTVDLVSRSSITQNSTGTITAATLTGSSTGYTDLLEAGNAITNLDNYTTGSTFNLTTTGNLAVNGELRAEYNVLLDVNGTLSESGAGAIVTGSFGGSSQGAVTLNGANNFSGLTGFSTANGAFALIDAQALQVSGTLNVGTGNVTLTTTAGNPLTIDAAQTVSAGASWALNSGGELLIRDPINVTGNGALTLNAAYDTQTVPGSSLLNLIFEATGAISYGSSNTGGTLTINGTPYTLLYTMNDVQNVGSGIYALADGVTASGTYTSAVIPNFSGTLEGLGNSISGLTINDTSTSPNTADGLFGTIGATATVRDLALKNVAITGGNYGVEGALAGENLGTIANATVSGNVTGAPSTESEGGLVGNNTGVIAGSGSSATVTGSSSTENEGGLVGSNSGFIATSGASANVTGSGYENLGGLVGSNGIAFQGSTSGAGTISNSSSFASVTATAASGTGGGAVGGLVGNNNATIEDASTDAFVTVALAGQNAGGIAGVNSGTIAQSFSQGITKYTVAYGSVGGIAGSNTGLIETSTAVGQVTGQDYVAVGGLVGNNNGSITSSSASGNITGVSYSDIGGLVGDNNGGSIISSSATGGVTGGSYSYIGGLVGDTSASISESYALGEVTGTPSSYIGGLVGYATGNITDAYAAGSVTVMAVGSNTTTYIGGLIGYTTGNVTNAYATGAVYAGGFTNVNAGGLIGEASSAAGNQISNVYATGNVIADTGSNVGGLVGLNSMNVSYAYATGIVASSTGSNVGGLIGQEDYGYTTLTDTYWNTTTSGLSNGVGLYQLVSGGTDPQPVVTGLTTTQLQAALPTGFSSSVWGLNASYNSGFPYLLALASSY